MVPSPPRKRGRRGVKTGTFSNVPVLTQFGKRASSLKPGMQAFVEIMVKLNCDGAGGNPFSSLQNLLHTLRYGPRRVTLDTLFRATNTFEALTALVYVRLSPREPTSTNSIAGLDNTFGWMVQQ